MSESEETKCEMNEHESISENTAEDLNEITENTHIEYNSLSMADNNDNNLSSSMNNSIYSSSKPSIYGLREDDSSKCLACQKKVYPMEMVSPDGKIYHKQCFKCDKCKTLLTVTNFNLSKKNILYCKTHFMERFLMRGKYDDDQEVHAEVKAGDSSELDDIPTTDTKSLLAKFREMELSRKSGSGDHRGLPPPMPNSPGANRTQQNRRYVQPTDDVVKAEDLPPDDLPAPDTTKSMVAMFKAMEGNNKKNAPTPETAQKMQKVARLPSSANKNIRLVGKTNKDAPVVTGDSSESNNMSLTANELPELGTTKNLLMKFQTSNNEEEESNGQENENEINF